MNIVGSKVINDYNGSKFRIDGNKEVVDLWGYKVVEPNFRMTSSYLKSCRQTQLKQELYDVRVAKEKLQYQLKNFGEVDQLDLMYYKTLCKRVGYSCPSFDAQLESL